MLLIFLFLVSEVGLAQSGAKDWYYQFLARKDREGNYPTKIAMIHEGEETRFLDIDVQTFNKLGYLKLVSGENALWNIKLNREKYEDMSPVAAINALTDADTVVEIHEKRWLFKQGKEKAIFGASAPTEQEPAAVMDWLIKSLGWDGVVLDQRGKQVLVGSSEAILARPEIQALAIAGSEKRFFVNRKNRKGSGLLSLKESWGGVAIFDVVFLGKGGKKIQPGTKLIIEKP